MEFIKKYGYWAIFVMALVPTLGSLYYGFFGDPFQNIITGHWFDFERGLEPCTLCWYARILMYPIVWISLMDIIKKKTGGLASIKFAAFLGVILEMYHYSIQKLGVDGGTTCSSAHPCNAIYVDYFDFITIPFLALVAFLGIYVVASIMTCKKKK